MYSFIQIIIQLDSLNSIEMISASENIFPEIQGQVIFLKPDTDGGIQNLLSSHYDPENTSLTSNAEQSPLVTAYPNFSFYIMDQASEAKLGAMALVDVDARQSK